MTFIELKQINKSFGSNHVLQDTSLEIQKGDLVTFLGPSGCGKSTLLRCIAGLESVSSGRIVMDGEDITTKEPKNRKIGMVFQQYNLFPNMNVFNNVAFGLKIQKASKADIKHKVAEMLEMVELEGTEKQYPWQLSGGQQQRVALARSLVAQPKVLLLDEPLSAIDAKLRRSLQERIKEIHKSLGLTTIFVTHDQDEAMIMSDMIHVLQEGRIEQSDEPVNLYLEPKTAFTAGFIGDYNLLSSEDFQTVTGARYDSLVAIRPEAIEVTTQPPEKRADTYQFTGRVKSHVPRGNVLRYYIDVCGVELKADTLFRTFKLYENDTMVCLTVEQNNCLSVE